jgi:hypothetical protein
MPASSGRVENFDDSIPSSDARNKSADARIRSYDARIRSYDPEYGVRMPG